MAYLTNSELHFLVKLFNFRNNNIKKFTKVINCFDYWIYLETLKLEAIPTMTLLKKWSTTEEFGHIFDCAFNHEIEELIHLSNHMVNFNRNKCDNPKDLSFASLNLFNEDFKDDFCFMYNRCYSEESVYRHVVSRLSDILTSISTYRHNAILQKKMDKDNPSDYNTSCLNTFVVRSLIDYYDEDVPQRALIWEGVFEIFQLELFTDGRFSSDHHYETSVFKDWVRDIEYFAYYAHHACKHSIPMAITLIKEWSETDECSCIFVPHFFKSLVKDLIRREKYLYTLSETNILDELKLIMRIHNDIPAYRHFDIRTGEEKYGFINAGNSIHPLKYSKKLLAFSYMVDTIIYILRAIDKHRHNLLFKEKE